MTNLVEGELVGINWLGMIVTFCINVFTWPAAGYSSPTGERDSNPWYLCITLSNHCFVLLRHRSKQTYYYCYYINAFTIPLYSLWQIVTLSYAIMQIMGNTWRSTLLDSIHHSYTLCYCQSALNTNAGGHKHAHAHANIQTHTHTWSTQTNTKPLFVYNHTLIITNINKIN